MSISARRVSLPVLLLLLLVLPSTRSAAQRPGIPARWSDGYVYANGGRIHYYRAAPAPSKPAIVMLHGATDIGLSWTTLTEKLQDSYDIYMLDARGHGLSDPYSTSDDATTSLKDVVVFLQAMKLEKPILMGHSMGAGTAMRLGADYPELAKAIILLDPGLGRTGPPGAAAPATAAGAGGAAPAAATASAITAPTTPAAPARPASAPDRLSVSMSGTPETLVAQNNYRLEDLVATCRRNTPKWALLDCEYWALSKKQFHGVYSAEVRQAVSGAMRSGDALAKIPVPVLLLKADATPELRKTHEEAARVMQRGRLVHIDGAGHNLHHDQLARTVEVIKSFLSTL